MVFRIIRGRSEVCMKEKMKRCSNCKTLLSHSSKVCNKCSSKKLENGYYTDESNKSLIYNKYLNVEKDGISRLNREFYQKRNT